MRTTLIILCLLSVAAPAAARPGFYVGLGVGGSSVHGSVVQPTHLSSTAGGGSLTWQGATLTTDIEGGVSLLFDMGFNILGYGAIETRLAGQGHGFDDAYTREWAAHWHTGIRAYPMWHWQSQVPEWLQPLEPSLFAGWGTTYQGYSWPPGSGDEVGWRTWGSWRFGLAVEYFVVDYFKVALDYTYVTAAHDRFIYDFSDSVNFNVEPTASTGFHQFYVMGIFQFSPAQEQVRH